MGRVRRRLLTGKYNNSPRPSPKTSGLTSGPTDKRLNAVFSERINDRNLAIARVVVEVARELSCTPSQVALAWLRTRQRSIIPIIGARRLDQLRDNLGSLDIKIPEEKLRELDDASHIDLGFPHAFLGDSKLRDRLFAGTYSRLVHPREP